MSHLGRLIALSLSLLAAAAPLAAQGEARYVLVITGGIPPYLRGELKLSRDGAGWHGTLAMEDRDSLLPITAIAVPGDSLRFEAPLLGGMRFRGVQVRENASGEAVAADGVVRAWTANRLIESQEYYPSLPRFTLRQIVVSGVRTSGPLSASLNAVLRPAGEVDSAYRSRAAAARWTPLSGPAFAADRGPRVLGLLDRANTHAAQRAVLSAIEEGIPDPAVRRRFSALFHPGGAWILDVHDAAIRFAQLSQPTFRLESVWPALQGLGGGVADSASAEQLLSAVYRLVQLRASDSATYSLMMQDSSAGPGPSRRALLTLINAYQPAFDWYASALRFLLSDPWLPAGLPGTTVAELVGHVPLPVGDGVPAIQPRLIGYAQAYPHVRTPDRWVDSLVHADNPNAAQWLARHGRSGLLLVLRQLPLAFDTGTVVAEGREEFRLTSVGQQATERETGFLEPADEILIEPGLAPLLAVQTVVHEWIHIRHEHAREEAGLAWRTEPGGSARYQAVTPVLAEGLAEWEAERVLAPLIGKWPLLGVFEAEKRAAMAAQAPDDPHLLGYRLASGLSGRMSETAVVRLLVRYAGDLDALARDPAVASSKAARPSSPAPGYSTPVLIPETRFSVDDTSPEVIGTRLVVPIRRAQGATNKKK